MRLRLPSVFAFATVFGLYLLAVSPIYAQQCANGVCRFEAVRNTVAAGVAVVAAPVQYFAEHQPVRTVVSNTACTVSNAYQEAFRSAQYRAANRIYGHSRFDTHRTSGVGWASHNSMPTTCLGRGGSNYAVVRGVDGWYATKFR